MSPHTSTSPLSEICVIALVNDDDCLARNLMASDLLAKHSVPLHIERGAASASIGYNNGIEATTEEYIVFAHQDVYFPPNWHLHLAKAIDQAEALDPNWAILAPFGITKDTQTHTGDVWSSGVGGRIGAPLTALHPAESVDELVIVMRRSAGLRFDNALPRYHLYGTDLVQMAQTAGKGAYIAQLPVIHNDDFKPALGADFTESYTFIRRKWAPALPLRSPVLWVTKLGLGLPWYRLRARRGIDKRQAKALDTSVSPRLYSEQCGWEET